jgi:hypothetical protein
MMVIRDSANLPQFNGHFKKYTKSYTMEKKGVSDEKAEAVVRIKGTVPFK